MTRQLRVSLPLGLLVLAHPLGVGADLQVKLPVKPVVQGDLRGLRVTAAEPLIGLEARFRGLSLPAPPGGGGYTILLAVDLETPPGPHPVEVKAQGKSGQRYHRRVQITVADGGFPLQHLTLPKALVDLDAETLERVRREEAVLTSIWETWKGEPYWSHAFIAPLEGTLQVSSTFGLRRIINGQSRSPHTGVDFEAAAGTPVRASNRGVVAYAGELFFSGNSVIVHHGGGLFTLYYHLQGYRVAVGQELARGDILGWVGATGRVTGPHLHWGARLQGARFNPERLLQLALP
ncbi:MAG: M23 family metallopeptidase [Candidatus Methylomirabilales bacterium]